MLEKLLEVVSHILEDTEDIDNILKYEELEEFRTKEILDKTDQDIKDFLELKEIDEEKRKLLFEIFQKLKIEQSIDEWNDDLKDERNEEIQEQIKSLFGKIIEPDVVEIDDEKVTLKYEFTDNSRLKNRIRSIEQWSKDNVIESVSKKFSVPIDNITFVDSVGAYIEFISGFEENNYVSRGQKDCSYDLIPSLYRLYENEYVSHSSEYEDSFKQKILFYDDRTEQKNDEELRAYGQHFGLPTNYLDFTEAHLISLLFSVEEYNYTENHSIVFFVDALSYNRDTIKIEKKLIDFSEEELKATIQRQYRDRSYFICVGNCNERIHFQKGCFLKVEPGDSLENMLAKHTKIAIIDKECKKIILKELFRLGITFENIYPDKDNMVKTIRFIKENM